MLLLSETSLASIQPDTGKEGSRRLSPGRGIWFLDLSSLTSDLGAVICLPCSIHLSLPQSESWDDFQAHMVISSLSVCESSPVKLSVSGLLFVEF